MPGLGWCEFLHPRNVDATHGPCHSNNSFTKRDQRSQEEHQPPLSGQSGRAPSETFQLEIHARATYISETILTVIVLKEPQMDVQDCVRLYIDRGRYLSSVPDDALSERLVHLLIIVPS